MRAEEIFESEADIAVRLTKGVRDLLGKRMSAMARTEVHVTLSLFITDLILNNSFQSILTLMSI